MGYTLKFVIKSVAISCGLLTANGWAQNTWTGATDINWFNSSNWNPSIIPTATTNLFINNGTASITSGTANSATINIASDPNSSATINLSNGAALVTNGLIQGSGSGSINVNGGILLAGANNSNFFNNLGNITVNGSGVNTATSALIFNTNGFTDTATNSFSFTSSSWTDTSRALEKTGNGTLTLSGNSDLGFGNLYANGGTLNITGTMNDTVGYIAEQAGQTATVNVSGLWNNQSYSSLYVGSNGNGTLNVSGTLQSVTSYISSATTSTSSVNISGYWNNQDTIISGFIGSGALTIAQSGSVDNSTLIIGSEVGSQGVVNVNGVLNNGSEIDVGRYGLGTLNISGTVLNYFTYAGVYGGTGTINISGSGYLQNSYYLYIGESSLGTLNITNSGSVQSVSTYIGDNAKSYGVVTVSGSGYLVNSGDLYVGNSGTGILNISQSGSVNASGIILGSKTGAQGTLNLQGGTLLTGGLIKGSGSANLNLNGGTIIAIADNTNFFNNLGNITLNDVGVSSTTAALTINTNGFAVTATNNFSYNSGTSYFFSRGLVKTGEGSLTLSGNSDLGFGNFYINGGVLNITGTLNNPSGIIAEQVGQSATVNVSGLWNNQSYSSLYVGSNGNGTLNVSGTLQSVTAYISSATTSTSSVNISGYWNNQDTIISGFIGSGVLTIAQSGSVDNSTLIIGSEVGSQGIVNVNGVLNNGSEIDVGRYGLGTLNISGTVLNYFTYAGVYGGTGTINISGSGYLQNSYYLYIGESSVGALNITNSGSVQSASTYVGDGASGVGMVTVSNTAYFANSNNLIIGNSGTGVLNILDRGSVLTTNGTLGATAKSKGTLMVSNSGYFGSTNNLVVGGSGTGTLILADQATVQTPKLILANQPTANGSIIITSASGKLVDYTNNPAAITSGSGSGTVIFTQNGNLVFNNQLSGTNLSLLHNGSGTTTLGVANTYSGPTTINNGVLRMGVANAISNSSTITIANTGTFDMNGFNQQLGDLANFGNVRFKNIGTTLTLNNLSGSGTYHLDTNMVTRETDQIVINGNASGTHQLILTPGSGTPSGTSAPLAIVTIGGTNTARFFGGMDQGAYAYSLVSSGSIVQLANSGTYVSSSTSQPSQSSPPPTTSGPQLSSVAALTCGLSGAQSLMWTSQLDSLNKRMGDLRLNQFGKSNQTNWLDNIWIRSFGQQVNIDSHATGNDLQLQQWGVDVGTDHTWSLDRNNQLSTGVFAGYGEGYLDSQNYYGSNGKTAAINFGLYATWLHQDGWFSDAVIKGAHYSNSFTAIDQSFNQSNASYDGWGFGTSLEFGKQIKFAQDWFIEPSAQVSYLHLFNDSYTSTGANQVLTNQSDADIFQFRIGTRIGKNIKFTNGGVLQPYLKVGVLEQISSGNTVSIGTWSTRPNLDGTYVEVGAGIAWQINANSQVHLDYEAAFGDRYSKPWAVNVGYRYRF